MEYKKMNSRISKPEIENNECFMGYVNQLIGMYSTHTDKQIQDELGITRGALKALKDYAQSDFYAEYNAGEKVTLRKDPKHPVISDHVKIAILDDYQNNSSLTVDEIAKKHGVSKYKLYKIKDEAKQALDDLKNTHLRQDDIAHKYGMDNMYLNDLVAYSAGSNYEIKGRPRLPRRAGKTTPIEAIVEAEYVSAPAATEVVRPSPANASPLVKGLAVAGSIEGYDSKGRAKTVSGNPSEDLGRIINRSDAKTIAPIAYDDGSSLVGGLLRSGGMEGYDKSGRFSLGLFSRKKKSVKATPAEASAAAEERKSLVESLAGAGKIEGYDSKGRPKVIAGQESEDLGAVINTSDASISQVDNYHKVKDKKRILGDLIYTGEVEAYDSDNQPIELSVGDAGAKKPRNLKKWLAGALAGGIILFGAKKLADEKIPEYVPNVPGIEAKANPTPKAEEISCLKCHTDEELSKLIDGMTRADEIPAATDDAPDADGGVKDKPVIVPYDNSVISGKKGKPGRRTHRELPPNPYPVSPKTIISGDLDHVPLPGAEYVATKPTVPVDESIVNQMADIVLSAVSGSDPDLSGRMRRVNLQAQQYGSRAAATVRIANLDESMLSRYTHGGKSFFSSKDNTLEIPDRCLEDITAEVSKGMLFWKKTVPFSEYVHEKDISVVDDQNLSRALYRDGQLDSSLKVDVSRQNNSAFQEVRIEYGTDSDMAQVVLKVDSRFGDKLTRLYSIGIKDETGTVRKFDVENSSMLSGKKAAWGVGKEWLEGLVLEDKRGREKINDELRPVCGAEVIACQGKGSDDVYVRLTLPKSYLEGGKIPELYLGWTFDHTEISTGSAEPDMHPQIRHIRIPSQAPTGGGSMDGGDEIGPSAPINGGGSMSGGDEMGRR